MIRISSNPLLNAMMGNGSLQQIDKMVIRFKSIKQAKNLTSVFSVPSPKRLPMPQSSETETKPHTLVMSVSALSTSELELYSQPAR